jgi:ABC-type multidrug transport system fused ATPase/permease subunit
MGYPVIKTYRDMLSLFDAREQRDFWLLTALMIFVALVEVAGLSALFVLLQVLADPAFIQANPALRGFQDLLNYDSLFSFQIALSLTVTAVVFIGLIIKASGSYALIRFSAMRGYTISSRLLGAYLHHPYAWFLARNSAEIGKNVLNETDSLVGRVIGPALRLIANAFLVLAIVGFLIVVDPLVTVLSGALLGGSYALIYLRLRDRLRRAGEEVMQAFGERFRISQEAVGGIKDVKLLALEDSYMEIYAGVARRSARASSAIQIMSELPRFALEAITFGTLLVVIFVLLLRNDGNISDAVPTLGVFAFSVMRLLPALQQIYHGLASIHGCKAVLEGLADDYAEARRVPRPLSQVRDRLPLHRDLELSKVSFEYPTAGRLALSSLNLRIPARTTVGIVGGTGAGKTTLVDVVLGLLIPDAGEVRVDGVSLTLENRRNWQQSLGYVPQSIFLADDSIAANIAFGIPASQIDYVAVERAARIASLHDFVCSELPDGYATRVGERGVRLSGGQRQRIGIARALYRDPSLLIMDEATSALDNITEQIVMEAVQSIGKDKTIILIAHRLTTVKACDIIYLMERGRLAAQGNFEELVAANETFRRMADRR